MNTLNTKPVITLFNYDEANLLESHPTLTECISYKNQKGVLWIDVKDVTDKNELNKICDCYNLHQLVRENLMEHMEHGDLIEHRKRPRIEDHGDYAYIILCTLVRSKENDELKSEALDIILGHNYVITFRRGDATDIILEPVRKRIRTVGTKLRKSGADYLAYRLIDAIVDNYFTLLEWYGENIEQIESEMFSRNAKVILHDIQKMRRAMLFLRGTIWPIREILNSLQRGESRLVMPETRVYMRDIYDHAVQIIETLEASRDMMSSILEIYLSTINNRLNEVMKILTIISTIFIPLTFVTSLYGMNFKYMPELGWRYGYLMVWIIMLAVIAGMITFFRKRKWF